MALKKGKGAKKSPRTKTPLKAKISVPARKPSTSYDIPLWQQIVVMLIAIFAIVMVGVVVIRNSPFADSNIFLLIRITLSLAVAVIVSGTMKITWKGKGLAIRVTGAAAVFLATSLITSDVVPEHPKEHEKQEGSKEGQHNYISINNQAGTPQNNITINNHQADPEKVTQAKREELERRDLEAISEICGNCVEMVSLAGKAIGIVPFATVGLPEFCTRAQPILNRLNESNVLTHTLTQKAEIATITTILGLRMHGPLHPQYSSPNEILGRVDYLIQSYSALSPHCKSTLPSRLYSLLVHIRFMIISAAAEIIKNCDKSVAIKPQHRSDINVRLAEIRQEIEHSQHCDGLLCFDYIGTRMLSGGTLEAMKSGYRICSQMIDAPPATVLCSTKSLQLRLHILRLNVFSVIAQLLLPEQKTGSVQRNISELMQLAASTRNLPTGVQSSIDESLNYISEFFSHNPPVEAMASSWIDTLLANYIELESRFGASYPWNPQHLRIMVRDQIPQSHKLITALREAHELSPDYLKASIVIHYNAALLDKAADSEWLVKLAEQCVAYITELCSGDHVLHTPLRTPPEPSTTSPDQFREFHFFLGIIARFKPK